jgi:NAD+ diphosphatase
MAFDLAYPPNKPWHHQGLLLMQAEHFIAPSAQSSWEALFFTQAQLVELGWQVSAPVQLGLLNGQPVFVAELLTPGVYETQGLSLRSLLPQLPDAAWALLSRAAQLQHWQSQHRFCGQCGQPTRLSSLELCQECSACSYRAYPKIAPCVIGLVTWGDRLLLAHHQRHSQARYSLLAGFVEAGESAEAAFAREVFEEVGIRISGIRYVTSQAWPFPSQLMLGFFAEYAGGDLQLDQREIRDAAWFAPDNLPLIPPPHSIAGKLIALRLAELAQPL